MSDAQLNNIAQGMWDRRNPGNGAYIMRIHYSADPSKRTKEWKQQASMGMSENQWLREYEVNWRAGFGKRLYPEFSIDKHVCEPFPIPSTWTVVGGIDSGFINFFAAVAIASDYDNRLYIYKCHYKKRWRMYKHRKVLNEFIPQPECWWMDRSAIQDRMELLSENDENGVPWPVDISVAPAKIAETAGTDKKEVRVGIDKVGKFLADRGDGKGPGLKIFNIPENQELINEFLSYAAKEDSEDPEKVDDHGLDATRYAVVSGIEEPEVAVSVTDIIQVDREENPAMYEKKRREIEALEEHINAMEEDQMNQYNPHLDPMGTGLL